jgi:hypothetical protein
MQDGVGGGMFLDFLNDGGPLGNVLARGPLRHNYLVEVANVPGNFSQAFCPQTLRPLLLSPPR